MLLPVAQRLHPQISTQTNCSFQSSMAGFWTQGQGIVNTVHNGMRVFALVLRSH